MPIARVFDWYRVPEVLVYYPEVDSTSAGRTNSVTLLLLLRQNLLRMFR